MARGWGGEVVVSYEACTHRADHDVDDLEQILYHCRYGTYLVQITVRHTTVYSTRQTCSQEPRHIDPTGKNMI